MSGVEVASAVAGLVSASIAISIHLYGLKNQFETSFRVIDYLIVEWKLIQGYFDELQNSYDTAEFSSLQTARDAERMEIYKIMVEEIGELINQSDSALNGKSRWIRGKEQIKLMNGTLNEIRDRMRGLQNHILTGHAIFLNRLTTSNTLEQRGAILKPVEGEPDKVVPKLDMRNLRILDKADRIRMEQARATMEEDDDGWSTLKNSPTIKEKAEYTDPKSIRSLYAESKQTTSSNESRKNPAFEIAETNYSYPVGMAELPGVTEPRSKTSQRHSVMGPPPLPLKIPSNDSGDKTISRNYNTVGGYPYQPYSPPSSLSSPGAQATDHFADPLPQHRRANSASGASSAYQSPYNYVRPPVALPQQNQLSQATQPPLSPDLPYSLQPGHGATWGPQPTQSYANPRQPPQRSWSSSSNGSSVLPYPVETPAVQMPNLSPYVTHPPPSTLSRSTSGASHASRQSSSNSHASGWGDDDDSFI